jgi:hypothetical protein
MSDKPNEPGTGETPPPLPNRVPNWRRLDWWLGNTPEQIEEVNQEVEQMKQAPGWFRGCMVVFLLGVMALLIAAKGVLILIPTVGLIAIFGVHYLVTGKVLAPPIPLWFHIAFWALLMLTVFLVAAGE